MSCEKSGLILEDPDLDELDFAQFNNWLPNEKLSNNNNYYKEDEKTTLNGEKLSKHSEKQEHIIVSEIVNQGEGSKDFPQRPEFSQHVGNFVNQTNVEVLQNEPDQIVYKCSLCQRTFTSMDRFKVHIISVHEKTLQYNCSICDCDMKSTQELFDHISFVHEGKKQPNAISIKLSQDQISSGLEIVCEKKNLGMSEMNSSPEASISRITTSDTLLQPQKNSHENRSKLKSILLSSKSLNNNNYKKDQITMLNGIFFSKDSEKQEHIVITEIVFQGEGSKDFPQRPEFSQHVENCMDQTNVEVVQNEPDQIVYKCSLCQRTFTSMDKFKIHIISVHENTLQYNCSICDCDLKSTQELFDHISVVHEGKKQPNAISIKLSQDQITPGTAYIY